MGTNPELVSLKLKAHLLIDKIAAHPYANRLFKGTVIPLLEGVLSYKSNRVGNLFNRNPQG